MVESAAANVGLELHSRSFRDNEGPPIPPVPRGVRRLQVLPEEEARLQWPSAILDLDLATELENAVQPWYDYRSASSHVAVMRRILTYSRHIRTVSGACVVVGLLFCLIGLISSLYTTTLQGISPACYVLGLFAHANFLFLTLSHQYLRWTAFSSIMKSLTLLAERLEQVLNVHGLSASAGGTEMDLSLRSRRLWLHSLDLERTNHGLYFWLDLSLPADLSGLETFALSAVDLDSDPCTICLQSFVGGDMIVRLPCTHQYHRGCVARWLAQKDKCPMCQRKVFCNRGAVADDTCERQDSSLLEAGLALIRHHDVAPANDSGGANNDEETLAVSGTATSQERVPDESLNQALSSVGAVTVAKKPHDRSPQEASTSVNMLSPSTASSAPLDLLEGFHAADTYLVEDAAIKDELATLREKLALNSSTKRMQKESDQKQGTPIHRRAKPQLPDCVVSEDEDDDAFVATMIVEELEDAVVIRTAPPSPCQNNAGASVDAQVPSEASAAPRCIGRRADQAGSLSQVGNGNKVLPDREESQDQASSVAAEHAVIPDYLKDLDVAQASAKQPEAHVSEPSTSSARVRL